MFVNLEQEVQKQLRSFSELRNWSFDVDQSGKSALIGHVVCLGEDNPRYINNVLENVLRYSITNEWLGSLKEHGIISPLPGFFIQTDIGRLFVAVDGYRRIVGIIINGIKHGLDNVCIPVYSIGYRIDLSKDILTQMLDIQDIIHVRESFQENARFFRLRTLLLRGDKQKDIAKALNMTPSQVSMWKKAALNDEAFSLVVHEDYSVDAALKYLEQTQREDERKRINEFLGEEGETFTIPENSSKEIELVLTEISELKVDIPNWMDESSNIPKLLPTTYENNTKTLEELYKYITSLDRFGYLIELLNSKVDLDDILNKVKSYEAESTKILSE